MGPLLDQGQVDFVEPSDLGSNQYLESAMAEVLVLTVEVVDLATREVIFTLQVAEQVQVVVI